MTSELHNSRFLRAVRGEPTDTVPVWIMRQAGRYLPEYMAVRSKVTFMELCKTPSLAAEVTVTAQQVLGVDAAILFADLLPILQPMGFDLEYAKGEGPVIHNPLTSAAEVDRVRPIEDFSVFEYVYEAVRLIRRELAPNIPLLGFAGAPFTLASYAIEGGGSKNYIRTKTLMWTDRGAWDALLSRLVTSVVGYLQKQVENGCQAVQIFDSWAGCLSPADYREFVLPHTKRLVAEASRFAPVINFLTGNPALTPLQNEAGGQVLGVDWRVPLREAKSLAGEGRAVQGNLDPIVLYADQGTIRSRAAAVLDEGGRRGHIFNLGHGVLPDVPHQNVKDLVKMVHDLGMAR
ncbi:uroporphyrinogen decarboxylase [Planctomyces sp. SH-PL14]|uniref:uroporphyrinogen decarboxylase n=1 Tax=Planctomyces sp. SH-PL14 TaxID=1632864 RepID=UPI00078C3A99|nr:uroporphyrinogen decarboxylase [Planctomyces sp. SH-PL14]AMV21992.1 Uroporphyrinogen decarboxylase [Planctomyces sp. SH-PL14]